MPKNALSVGTLILRFLAVAVAVGLLAAGGYSVVHNCFEERAKGETYGGFALITLMCVLMWPGIRWGPRWASGADQTG